MFFLKKGKRQKPIVITVHGFGKYTKHEFDPLCTFLKENKYDVVQFDIYDPKDNRDYDIQSWIKRCENKIHRYKDRPIVLIGFSMGGVIASYLASIYKIQKLILIAPAFQYMNIQTIAKTSLASIKKIKQKDTTIPNSKQTKTFMDVINNYKNSIQHVQCPCLLLHGTKDEVIPMESSRFAYQNLSGQKSLLLIEGGKHRMLYDGKGFEKVCFQLILDALQDKLI